MEFTFEIGDLEKSRAIQMASESYFFDKTIELLTPCLDEFIADKKNLEGEIEICFRSVPIFRYYVIGVCDGHLGPLFILV